MTARVMARTHRQAQLFGTHHGVFAIDPWQQHGELLAADAADQVASAQLGAQAGGQGDQGGVAGGMISGTILAVFLVPVFFVVVARMVTKVTGHVPHIAHPAHISKEEDSNHA